MAKSKEDKLSELWTEVLKDDEPMEYYWSEMPNFFTQRANGSFCQRSDEMQGKRLKTTHTQGVVAQVEWVPYANDEGYTGVYESGSDAVLMRLSQTTNLTDLSLGLFPSMALKFLRDGDEAENLFAMPNFTGTDSWDFFRHPLKNRHLPFDEETHPIEVATLQKKLIEGSRRPFATAIGHIAAKNNDGSLLEQDAVKVPYELMYSSPQHFDHEMELNEDGSQVMFYDQLKRLEVGDTVYEVHALTGPACKGGDFIKIADIKLKTKPVTSKFGDTNLYFRHRRVQNDYKYWP